jgi:hypothetical protein
LSFAIFYYNLKYSDCLLEYRENFHLKDESSGDFIRPEPALIAFGHALFKRFLMKNASPYIFNKSVMNHDIAAFLPIF